MAPATEDKGVAGEPVEPGEELGLDSIREILLQPELGRIGELEQEIASLRQQALSEKSELEAQVAAHQKELGRLQEEVAQLRQQVTAESEALIPHLISQMGSIVSRTIRNARDEMAEALGPVMGDAIRVQIRDAREDMVEALYPVILATVQRAITEFAREFQRNIDARVRATFGPQGFLRRLSARLRGVSGSELAFRDSFPFSVQSLFLIQHESGLLLADDHPGETSAGDSDLISGMLTAIRDFAHDSFGAGKPAQQLDEIQYGDQRIVIQSGQNAYLAVVTTGIEPEWFRSRLHLFVSELHIEHGPELRDYGGESETLPAELPRLLAELPAGLIALPEATPRPASRARRWAIAIGGLVFILFVALACFYLQFTIALLPLAFGDTPTPTATTPPTATVGLVAATATAVPAVTEAPTDAPVPPATETVAPTSTPPPPTPSPTATSLPSTATSTVSVVFPRPVTNAPVWIRPAPNLGAPVSFAIPANAEVTVLAQFGTWVEVEYAAAGGAQRGWLGARWLTLSQPIPDALITPTPEP